MMKSTVSAFFMIAFVFAVCCGAYAGEEQKSYRPEEKSYRLVIGDKIEAIESTYDSAIRRAETSFEVMDAGIQQYLALEKLGAEVLAVKLAQYADNPAIAQALQNSYDATQVMRVFLRERVRDDLNFGAQNIRDARSLEIDSHLSVMNIRQMLELY